MATIGSTNLTLVNDRPEVEVLWNGRYRLTFFCDNGNGQTDWYNENKGEIFPAFGALQSVQLGEEGKGDWSAPDGSVYDNMRLIEAGTPFIPSVGKHYVKLVYETITGAYVQTEDDTIDYELNGLRRVSRPSIAISGTSYTGVVGTTSIVHDDPDGTGTVTLYLGAYKVLENDAFWLVTETYLERGTLSFDVTNEAEGILRNTTTFFGVIGTTVGPIVSQKIGDFQGFQTIVVSTLTDKDGNPLGASSDPVSQFDQYVNFRYPGEVSIATDVDTINNATTGDIATTWNSHWYSLITPVTTAINARVYVFFQTGDQIVAGDLVYDGATGLWNPNEWAKGRVDGLGTNFGLTSVRQTAQDKVFTEYTVVSGGDNSVSGTAGYADGTGAVSTGAVLLEGTYILPDAAYSLTVSGGPGRPDGIKYVVSPPTLTPAFDDIDGVQVWKKVIVVATIPTR